MKTLIETVEDKLVTQISKFCSIYPTYAGLLKADATKISNLNEGSLFMIFVLMMQGKVQTLATAFTAYKDLVFYGKQAAILWVHCLCCLYMAPLLPLRQFVWQTW